MRRSDEPRRAVRGLLLTPDNKVLLIKIKSPLRNLVMWMTPGGGIEPGESKDEALTRELYEETGLTTFSAGPMVWTREFTFPWNHRLLHQYEEYYLIRTPGFEPTMDHNPAHGEKQIFQRFRWWPLQELLDSQEKFAPWDLGRQLNDLLKRLRTASATSPAQAPALPISLPPQKSPSKKP